MPPAAKPMRTTRVPDIRTGDEVIVLAGKDAGKRGVVTKVIRNSQGWKKSTARYGSGWQRTTPLVGAAVVVDGLNIDKRHTKPRARAGATERQPRVQQGGILEIAMPINISNVMVIDPTTKLPTRIRHETAADGRSIRVSVRSGEPLINTEKKRK
jgi:large subunit ribosomal protein L24